MRTALIIVCIFLTGGFLRAEPDRVPFFKGSFQEMRQQAIQQQKPYIVFFYTDWCNPCQNMQKYTFSNGSVSQFVKEHYLAFSSNAESISPEGNELALRFRITFYPTVLIIGPDGKERARIGGYKQSKEMLALLKQYVGGGTAPVATSQPTTSIPSTTARTSTAPTTVRPPVVAAARPPTTFSGTTPPAPSKVANSLSVETLSVGSYVVQTGVFTGFKNVVEEVKQLEAKGFDTAIMHVVLSGQDAFKVFVGPYTTRAAAAIQQKSLLANGKQGFIVVIN